MQQKRGTASGSTRARCDASRPAGRLPLNAWAEHGLSMPMPYATGLRRVDGLAAPRRQLPHGRSSLSLVPCWSTVRRWRRYPDRGIGALVTVFAR